MRYYDTGSGQAWLLPSVKGSERSGSFFVGENIFQKVVDIYLKRVYNEVTR
jgi:hypothetical protein